MLYHKKIIISGNYLELYEYDKKLKRGFTKKKKILKEQLEEVDLVQELESENEKKELSKRKDSISRTRTQIRRLVNSNQDFTKFYTLTFKENVQDIKKANKCFNKFIMKMNYHYGDFKYLSIIEFQKRGAVHYHFLCNLPFIKSKEVEKIWSHGFIKINRIKHVDNLGAYVCKYLQKDMTDKKMFNKKKYFCSKNVERPIDIYEESIVKELIAMYDFNFAKPYFFENEYVGKVKYRQIKIQP